MSNITIPPISARLKEASSWLINAGIEDTKQRLATMTGTDDDMEVLRHAIAKEKSQPTPRPSRLKPMEAKLNKFSTAARTALIAAKGPTSSKPESHLAKVVREKREAKAAEVTTDQPKDPRWDQAREISAQLKLCGRLYLRGQVKLGMILAALKKEFGIRSGKHTSSSPDSGKELSWPERVKQETGYSRQSCDEFIRLYEATKTKLKNSKKLKLPAPVKKDALVLFKTENPLALSDKQWEQVDTVISSLTTGETQISLMQELGIVPKPKAMPKGTKTTDDDDDTTAGQLAFHFFDAVAAPLINARTNPDYKRMLLCLPFESDEENPLSLATLEAEARALIADIEEARKSAHKATRGRTINV